MANQITDNRTLVNSADSVTGYVDLSGAAAGTVDTEIFFEGTGSIGEYLTSTLSGLLYDTGSAQDFSGNTFYFLINCGIVGLLANKASGGFRIRFTGATVTDWFEVYVGGGDEWLPSFSGGWTLFSVDIDVARATAITNGWTNGTTPATTAIQRFGWAGQTGGTMPRMVDNTWMDAIYRLPANTPSIIVEGRSGGTTDWDFIDVVTQMASVSSPVARFGSGGAITLSGSIQFGLNDTTTHGFTDTNRTVLFDDQEFIDDTLYSLSAVGNSGGTTNVTFGVKSGTGSDAIGAQGVTISAATGGARWSMDFNDQNLDSVGFYGCSFQHGDSLLYDENTVEAISTLLIDCSSATLSTASTGIGTFLKNSIINANTLDGTPFITVETLNTLDLCNFQFSDGYAIDLGTVDVAAGDVTMAWKCNDSGYGANQTSDSTITANITNGGTNQLVINVEAGASTPTVNNTGTGGAADVAIVSGQVTSTVTVQDGSVSPPVTITDQTVNVLLEAAAGGDLAVGTDILKGFTNTSGQISDTRSFTANQPVTGWARRASADNSALPSGTKYFKEAKITGTIDKSSGANFTVLLQKDE